MAGVYIPGIDIPTEKPVAILLCTDRSVGLYDVVAGQLRHIRECEPAIPVPDHGRPTMDDYISRKAALKAIYTSTAPALEVKAMPAADVVEVVRCKDCIYWRGANDLCKGICIDFDADGYCSEGKRKDGGQDK